MLSSARYEVKADIGTPPKPKRSSSAMGFSMYDVRRFMPVDTTNCITTPMLLERTHPSRRFYAHTPCWLQKIPDVYSHRVIFQLFLERSTLLEIVLCSSVIRESTYIHLLRQQI